MTKGKPLFLCFAAKVCTLNTYSRVCVRPTLARGVTMNFQFGLSRSDHTVVLITAHSHSDAMTALQALRQHQTVVLMLEHLQFQQAQRLTDFIWGGTLALEGYPVQLGRGTFMFTPGNVKVTHTLDPEPEQEASHSFSDDAVNLHLQRETG
jgi:FtsZ-interacting cell division protein YlmF